MARSTKEYYDILIAEKQSMSSLSDLQPSIDDSQTLLSDLNTTSRVSPWRLVIWLAAYCLHIHETVLEMLAASTESGTPLWYQKVALAFQYGDPLVIINNTPEYATINTANQIIKLVAIVESVTGIVVFKVSKLDTGGEPQPLTIGEKAAFMAYINLKKFAGTITTVVSQAADDLKLGAKVQIDPLVLNLDGSLITDSSIFPVEIAIKNYLKALPYNGLLKLDKLEDEIQKSTGVVHAFLTQASAKPFYAFAIDYVNIMADPLRSYNPEAGYLRESTAAGETLSDLIEYVV